MPECWEKSNVIPILLKKFEYLSRLVKRGIFQKNVQKLKWTLPLRNGVMGVLLLPVGMIVRKKIPDVILIFYCIKTMYLC